MSCINSNKWTALLNLLLTDHTHVLNRIVSRVFSKSKRDLFESVREGSNSILLYSLNLVSFSSDSKRTCKFSCATTCYNQIVSYHIAHNTNSIMQTTSRLITDGFRTSTNEYGYGFRLLTIFNEDNSVV